MTELRSLDSLKGHDMKFNRVIDDAKLAAATDFNVLILGETGTGKSLIAGGIHKASKRSSHRFETIDLGLLNHETQNAELFGYVKGAYTGASDKGRDGLVAAADQGTVFLDEIGDASGSTQSKLLRLLQDRTIRKLGDNKEIPVDVRVIAATNQDIKEKIQNKTFRADLYFRLKVIVLNVPSLKHRHEKDFDNLTDLFLKKYSVTSKPITIDKGAREFLREYPARWPGNVRELEATIQRLISLCESDTITRKIAEEIIQRQVTPEERILINGKTAKRETLQDAREKAERDQLEQALKNFAGNRSKVADKLGTSTRQLSRLITKYGL